MGEENHAETITSNQRHTTYGDGQDTMLYALHFLCTISRAKISEKSFVHKMEIYHVNVMYVFLVWSCTRNTHSGMESCIHLLPFLAEERLSLSSPVTS